MAAAATAPMAEEEEGIDGRGEANSSSSTTPTDPTPSTAAGAAAAAAAAAAVAAPAGAAPLAAAGAGDEMEEDDGGGGDSPSSPSSSSSSSSSTSSSSTEGRGKGGGGGVGGGGGGSPTSPGRGGGALEGWRFKLYQLDAEGQWDDKGTGYLAIKNDERLGGPAFHAVSEDEGGGVLLSCRVVAEDIYQRQGDNIITWTEPGQHGKEPYDMALSFQDEQGCREIWDKLVSVQGRFHSDYRAFEAIEGVFEGVGAAAAADEGKPLPFPPEPGNLGEILAIVLAVSPLQRDRYVRTLLDQDCEYLRRLMALFQEREQQADVEGCRLLARLFKNIVLLNDLHLSEALIQKSMFLQLAAVMEYDPDLRERASYRRFITQEARFHQVLPLEDAKAVEKIEETFHLTLLRDHMLRPTMEEANLTSLSSLIFFNSTFLLDRVYRESDYLQRVYKLLQRVNRGKYPTPEDEANEAAAAAAGAEEEAEGEEEEESRSLMLPLNGGSGGRESLSTQRPPSSSQSSGSSTTLSSSQPPQHTGQQEEGGGGGKAGEGEGEGSQSPSRGIGAERPPSGGGSSSGRKRKAPTAVVVKTAREKRAEIWRFLKELVVGVAKATQPTSQAAFFKYLAEECPFFQCCVPVLSDPLATAPERMCCAEVLLALLNHDPAHIRSFICEHTASGPTPAASAAAASSGPSSSSATGAATPRYLHPPKPHASASVPSSASTVAAAAAAMAAGGNGSPRVAAGMSGSQQSLPPLSPPALAEGGQAASVSPSVEGGRPHQHHHHHHHHHNNHKHGSGSRVLVGGAPPPAAGAGEYSLLYWLIRRLTTDEDAGVLVHLCESLMLCLDIDSMEGSERDRFLGLFYDHYIIWLVEPLMHLHLDKAGKHLAGPKGEEGEATAAIRGHVVDVLTYCVRAHGYRMRYFVILNNLAQKVLRLTHAREKHLRLAAVRFLRAIVSTKDEFYNRHLVKNNLLSPVLALFVDNGPHTANLVHSAIIELFDFIRVEPLRGLLEYLVERFREQVANLAQTLPTFRGLLEKYDKARDFEASQRSGGSASSAGGGGGGEEGEGMAAGGGEGPMRGRVAKRRAVDDEDEAYFNEEDEEEEEQGEEGGAMEDDRNPAGVTVDGGGDSPPTQGARAAAGRNGGGDVAPSSSSPPSPSAALSSGQAAGEPHHPPPPSGDSPSPPPPLRLVNYDDEDEEDDGPDPFWSGKGKATAATGAAATASGAQLRRTGLGGAAGGGGGGIRFAQAVGGRKTISFHVATTTLGPAPGKGKEDEEEEQEEDEEARKQREERAAAAAAVIGGDIFALSSSSPVVAASSSSLSGGEGADGEGRRREESGVEEGDDEETRMKRLKC